MRAEYPSTPEVALALGLTRYFTGALCRNGHIAPRRTQNGDCVVCRMNREKRRKARRTAEKLLDDFQ